MSNRCIHIDVSKLAIFVLLLFISVVMTTKANAMAVKVQLAEPVVSTGQGGSDAVTEKKSKKLSLKPTGANDLSKEKIADKLILGKKLAGNGKKLQTRVDTSTSDRLRQMMAMVVIILVLGGISWLVCKKLLPRLKGPTGIQGRVVKIIETTYISPRQPVHLLQVGDKKLLIAGGKDGLRMLADVTDDFSGLLDQQQPELAEANL